MAKKKELVEGRPVSECPAPKGKVLAIGGREGKGEEPERGSAQARNTDFIQMEVLERFTKELNGSNPMILVCPTASGEPEAALEDYKAAFRLLEHTNIEVLDVKTRLDACRKENVELVQRAAGVIFTGGDQLKLTALFGGSPVLAALKQRYTYEDFIIAGTSAGAMALSTPMIYEGQSEGGYIKGDVRITTGLEFLKDVLIDTHFIARGRIIRMAQALATNPGCIGIGLEEDTAVLVTEGKHVEVVGNGLIMVVDPMQISSTNIYEIETGQPFTICDLKVHMFADGDRYTIPTFDQLHI